MLDRQACASLVIVAALAACAPGPPSLDYEILGTFPHDSGAYTQGLLFHDGRVFESTGRHGFSSVRRVDVPTGRVLERTAVDSAYFGEGLARVGSELIQLTWKAGVAFVYDLESLELKRRYSYDGEGWGLCFDESSLYMSDGSSTIYRRDPETFEVLGEIAVTSGGAPLSRLNELECVGEFIYANVYQTDRVVRIDKRSGQVTGVIDLSSIPLSARALGDVDAVLNGIAFIPETGVFLVTGKLWPTMFAIRLAGP